MTQVYRDVCLVGSPIEFLAGEIKRINFWTQSIRDYDE